MENWEGTKNVRKGHTSYPCEFFSIFGFGIFQKSFDHLLSVMNLFKLYPSNMKSKKNFKNIKQVKNWECTKNVRILHILHTHVNFFSIFGFEFFRKSFHHLLSVMNLFKQHPSHMKSQKNLKTSNKWRIGRLRRMWEFLTFFVPLWIF